MGLSSFLEWLSLLSPWTPEYQVSPVQSFFLTLSGVIFLNKLLKCELLNAAVGDLVLLTALPCHL